MYLVSKAQAEDFEELSMLDYAIAVRCADSVRLVDSAQAWRSWIECGLIHVARDTSQEIIAAVVAFPTKGKGWCIHKVLVEESYLQSDVAQELLEALLARIDRREDDVSVVAHPNDFFSICLYMRLCFSDRTLHPSYLGEGEDRLVMRRPTNWADLENSKGPAVANNVFTKLSSDALSHMDQAVNEGGC